MVAKLTIYQLIKPKLRWGHNGPHSCGYVIPELMGNRVNRNVFFFILIQENSHSDNEENQLFGNGTHENSIPNNCKIGGTTTTFYEVWEKWGYIFVEFVIPLAVLSVLNTLLILKVSKLLYSFTMIGCLQ